jgi:hypothetical protein
MTFVMVKCGVFFEVRTEFLYIIYTKFGFKCLTSFIIGDNFYQVQRR